MAKDKEVSQNICKSLAKAHKLYGNEKAIIVFINEENYQGISDFRIL
jgi:hypothetical protein